MRDRVLWAIAILVAAIGLLSEWRGASREILAAGRDVRAAGRNLRGAGQELRSELRATGREWWTANKHGNRSITTNSRRVVRTCDDLEVRMDGRIMARAVETVAVAKSNAPMRIEPPDNGGVFVRGWAEAGYSILMCKDAGGDDRADAEKILSKVRMLNDGGRFTATGPGNDDDWVVHFIVMAPEGAQLTLRTHNGPIDLRSLRGTIDARSVNGPIGLDDVRGEVRAETENGPISVGGGGGKQVLRTQNGPLTLRLASEKWEGGELDGSTQNGPVTVSLPESFQSGLRIDASGHSPISCRAAQCKGAPRTWDNPNRIEFGGSPVMRLSTVNGPVDVNNRSRKYDSKED